MIFCCFAGKRVLNFKMSLNNKYTTTLHVAIYTEYYCIYLMLELESEIKSQEFLIFIYWSDKIFSIFSPEQVTYLLNILMYFPYSVGYLW